MANKTKTLREWSRSMDKYLIETMLKYGAEVSYDISIAVNQIGREALTKVKAESPKRTGKYRKGWRIDFRNRDGVISCIVHQKEPTYRLTHLLEHGHRTKTGGRTKAQPHIQKVEKWAEAEVMKAIEKAVKG